MRLADDLVESTRPHPSGERRLLVQQLLEGGFKAVIGRPAGGHAGRHRSDITPEIDFSLLSRHRDHHHGTPAAGGSNGAELIGGLDNVEIEWVRAGRRLGPRLVVDLPTLGWLSTCRPGLLLSNTLSAGDQERLETAGDPTRSPSQRLGLR